MIRLVIISDTHGLHGKIKDKFELPEGDILIHAGDVSNIGDIWDIERFINWFARQPFDNHVFIAGNHDWGFEKDRYAATKRVDELNEKGYDIHYLEDRAKVIEGLKFHGSPVTKPFCNWAFNRDQETRQEHWSLIDDDVDILITHGPPRDILDFSAYGNEHVGCPYLRMKVLDVKPLVHAFGHIHHSYGTHEEYGTLFINASTLNERYRVANKPIVVDVDVENKTATLVN